MTLEKLGVAIGLDESCASTRISRYEHGIHVVEPNTAERIAQALDVPLAYFYADSEELAKIIQIFGHLEAEKQQQLLKYAQELQEK